MGKVDFRNSLSKTAINYYDKNFIKSLPKKTQTAQEAYSIDSTFFNNYYRLSKKDFVKIYGLDLEKK